MYNKDLSPTMKEALNMIEVHGELVRYSGGFWSWSDCKMEHYRKGYADDFLFPVWHCDVKTLRALSNRKLVILNETEMICRLKTS